MRLPSYVAVPLFVAAFVVVSGTVFAASAFLYHRMIPFGFGVFPAAALGAVLGFLGAQRAVQRVGQCSPPLQPTFRDLVTTLVGVVVYFVASTVAALVLVFGLSPIASLGASYFPALLISAIAGLFAARIAARSLLGVSRSWALFAAALVCASLGLMLALNARETTGDWIGMVAQQGVVIIAGFWLLAPEPIPNTDVGSA
jgi:hypothetical protein